MGDINREAVRSLKAIDAWVGIIENNIEGSQRHAFKAVRPKFADMSTKLMNKPSEMSQDPAWGGVQYIPIPSAALTITEVKGDQRQGDIIRSTEEAHMAIQGEGYFVCVQRGPSAGASALDINEDEFKFYYTRDGQFHFDPDGFLRTSNGMYVVSRDFPPYRPEQFTAMAAVTAGTRSIQDFFVSKTRQAINLPPGFQRGPDLDPGSTNYDLLDVNRIQLARFPTNLGLEYSKYGTEYLNEGTAAGRPEFFGNDDPGGFATIKLYSLEGSNTSLTEWIPILASSAKMFSAISKIIQIYNSTVDDMNNTIR